MLKERGWRRLNVVITLSTTLIAVFAVSIITIAMNRRFNVSIERSTQQNNTQIIENVTISIDSYLKEMISISDRVSEWLNERGVDSQNQPFDLFLRDDIDTIMVVDSTGKPILRTDDQVLNQDIKLTTESWFTKITPGSVVYQITPPHVQRIFENKSNWVISLSRGVSWVDHAQRPHQGLALVDLNFRSIQELCSREVGDSGYVFILGPKDEIIYHPQQQMIYAGIANPELETIKGLATGNQTLKIGQKKYNVMISELKNTDWRVIGVSPLQGLFSFDRQLKSFILMIVLVTVGVIIFLSITVSFSITKPIRQLISLMKQVEEGDLSIYSQVDGIYEVVQLSNSFNAMVGKVDKLMRQVLREQKELRKNELTILHTQISPHFLYNTLDSIVWMAESGDQQTVIRMIEALARFFRLSLAKGEEKVSVLDELKHVESYLTIQKIRFSDQFDYELTLAEDLHELKTLKIMLQPIVENAIIHGVANLPYKGLIEISAYRAEDCLVFSVKDNGFGIMPEKLAAIQAEKQSKHHGIGIQNVSQRIQIMYGKEYGLVYESEPDEGTTVYIKLPVIKD